MTVGRRTLLVAALLVAAPIAGCNTAPADGEATAPTVTPAPVPTDDAGRAVASGSDPGGGSALPAVGGEGPVSAADIAGTHREALLATSFTRTVTETIRGPNGTVRRTERTVRVEPDPLTYYYARNQTVEEGYPVRAFAPRFELWSNESHAISRTVRDGSVSYRIDSASAYGEAVTEITGNEALLALLGVFEFRVERAGGGYHLRSTALVDRERLPTPTLTENATNATMTAWVSERGIVRSYRVAYDVRRDGRRLRVIERAEVSAVGETSVERPPWYGAAVENASRSSERR
ncbi:hypothetical protein BRC94_05735 [Halobacteriales archaeon QS_5_70_17]|nr:MAG: hypothetical protein BRC94_05735 [Halobacteriales archaeon QS_5_70_17]